MNKEIKDITKELENLFTALHKAYSQPITLHKLKVATLILGALDATLQLVRIRHYQPHTTIRILIGKKYVLLNNHHQWMTVQNMKSNILKYCMMKNLFSSYVVWLKLGFRNARKAILTKYKVNIPLLPGY